MPRFSFIPREQKFFDLFEQDATNLVKGAHALSDLIEHWDNIEDRVKAIADIEHSGDAITHEIIYNLHRTFVTPLDREDITALANAIDDVMDFIQAASDIMLLYKIQQPTPRAHELAHVILDACQEIERAVPIVRHQGKLRDVLPFCVELNRLENDADEIYRAALSELFSDTKDFAFIIKWREIYEQLESATDRCEDVANVLEGVALKYA
ncbi:MAG: DUF47 domain-containing protein [Chloroflexi bacterium]|nr:DUF47 domain-containing protein [Chloroflexota bacterium]